MKTAIVYFSKHHGNTEKLLNAIKSNSSDDIMLFDASKFKNLDLLDLSEYDLIGYASGIYYSKFDKRILNFAKSHTPSGKNVFFVYTYGTEKPGYTKAITEAVAYSGATIIGEYGCLGFNTFGPFKLIGGMAKNHPNNDEINGAVSFYNNLNK